MTIDILEKQKLQHRLDDAGEFPKVVLVDAISNCNLSCSMCVHKDMVRAKGAMPWDLFTKIIDEVAAEDKNARVWMVFFGEPFLLKKKKPTIFDMVAYAKKKGLTDVVLNSNANIMDEECARKIIEAGLDTIYFGIDAFKPETYDKVRVGGDYWKTVENVRRLIRIKEETGAPNPRVFTQFVVMDVNEGEKDDFIKFWTDEGASVKIRPKVSWGGLIEAKNLTLGQEERWPCYWAMRTMSITNLGKVVTCAVDLDASYIAGDANESTLRDIWKGDLKRLRGLHLSGRYNELPGLCGNCRDWQSARADFYAINP